MSKALPLHPVSVTTGARSFRDLRSVLASIGLAVVVVDREGTVQLISGECERLFGMGTGCIGHHIGTIRTGLDLSAIGGDIDLVMTDLQPRVREVSEPAPPRVFQLRLTPYMDGPHEAIGCTITITDITEAVERNRRNDVSLNFLAANEALFRELLTNAPFAVGIHTGPEHRCIFANDEFRTWHPQCDPVGTTLAERGGAYEGSSSLKFLDSAFQTGESAFGRMAPHVYTDADGRTVTRYFTGVAQPYRGRDGAVAGVMAMTFEATEEKLLSDRQNLLVSELRHRAKNLLAVVQAVAVLSAESATDKDDLLERLEDRLQAIARSNTHLASGEARPCPLRDLIDRELGQIGPAVHDRIRISVADIALTGTQSSILTLVLHELVVNAIKHGVFSTPIGTVEITCPATTGTADVTLTWSESFPSPGASGAQERREGFGMLLLTEIAPRELNAAAALEFRPSGLHYTIRFPSPRGAADV